MYVKETSPSTAVEYTLRQLRSDNPNVSFSSTPNVTSLADYDVYPATVLAEPAYDKPTQKLEQADPVKNGSDWEVGWNIVAKTAEEAEEYTKEKDRKDDVALLKADAQVLALLKARPDQINNYIDTNVTNLSSARTVLKILARAVAVLAHTTVN